MSDVKSLLLKENLDIKVVCSEIEMHPLLAVEENIINTGSNWYQSTIKLVRKNV